MNLLNKGLPVKGNKFGRWNVLGCLWRDEKSNKWWLCKCDCGTIKNVREAALINKSSQSCGCLRKEIQKANGYKYVGSNNPNWKDNKKPRIAYSRTKVMGHHRADSGGFVYDHVLIMEAMLKRLISHKEVVHHCDGNVLDNRPFNLRLFPNQAVHAKYHANHGELNV